MGKLNDILKKLATGGFLSGSADTDIAVLKAEEEVKKEIDSLRVTGDLNINDRLYNQTIDEIKKRLF